MTNTESLIYIYPAQNQKILFLEIDGVLISEECSKNKLSSEKTHSKFDPLSVSLIKSLIEEFSLKIVISSSWRYEAIDRLIKELKRNELLEYLYYDWFTPVIYPAHRGMEIKQWLDVHPEVNEYVIIDDDENILDGQKENFVKTDLAYGMITENYNRVRTILSSVAELQ